MARLNLNESPFPPSPRVVEELARAGYVLNRYFDEELWNNFVKALSHYAKLPREYVSPYPSSSDALCKLLRLARFEGMRVVVVWPGFFALRDFARVEGVDLEFYNLKLPNFELDVEELLKLVDEKTMLILCNPNNPTSNMLIEDGRIVEELSSRTGILVVDEAYYEFSGVTFAHLVKKLENLVIVRTLSKAFCLAGARVGYVLAHPSMISKLDRLRVKFDIPIPSIAAAYAALRDLDYVKKVVEAIKVLRDRMASRLRELGLRVLPSATNFLFVELPRRGAEVAEELKKMGVYVAFFDEPPIQNFIRVSVGREDENARFVRALARVLGLGRDEL